MRPDREHTINVTIQDAEGNGTSIAQPLSFTRALDAMKRLWGRKVNDLSFATFLEILQTVAAIKGKLIHFVDRFYPSSKTCSHCGHVNQGLNLKDRTWDCPSCHTKGILRDWNAAANLSL